MRSRLLLPVLFSIAAMGCTADPATVSFEEIRSNGLAHFRVENRSERDIAHLTFELTYLSADGEVLLVDTLRYRSAVEDPEGGTPPFLEAHDETFFVQAVPAGGVSARASILALTYVDSTTWSGAE